MARSEGEHRQMFAIPGSSIGLKIASFKDSAAQVQQGLSYQKLIQFQRVSLLPMDVVAGILKMSKRTMARRTKEQRLSADESERLLRLSLIFEKATNLFEGDRRAARAWLNKPCKALGDTAPWDVAKTELGARAVENLIGQLEQGVFP